MSEKSPLFIDKPNILLAINILIPSCLVYALAILHDTCDTIFVILDFPPDKE